MGQQTRFFMNDGDWLDFLNHAREAGFTFLPQLTPAGSDPVPLSAKELFQFAERTLPYFYLLPKPLTLDAVVYQELASDVTRLKLINYQSPVIEVSPCQISENALSPGRIYFNMRPNLESKPIVQKAYRSLARRLKKWSITTEYSIPVGPKTKLGIEKGSHVIRELGTELRVKAKE